LFTQCHPFHTQFENFLSIVDGSRPEIDWLESSLHVDTTTTNSLYSSTIRPELLDHSITLFYPNSMVTLMSQGHIVLHSGAPSPHWVDDFLRCKVAVRKTTDAFLACRAPKQNRPFFPCRGGLGGKRMFELGFLPSLDARIIMGRNMLLWE
jgi:hypothetical protein